MANPKKKVVDNVAGDFFVDTSCINCDACRKIAPKNYGDNGEYSFIQQQPKTDTDRLLASMAILACPVGAIGTDQKDFIKKARSSFPFQLKEDVFLLGYNHRSSFGADSYLVTDSEGNWMMDAPRFDKSLVKAIKQMGGLSYIFLSHQDDVADAQKYAAEFGAERIIHEWDIKAQPDAEIIIEDLDEFSLGPAKVLPVPGHTKGSQVLVWKDQYIFTGDHLAYSRRLGHVGAFHNACWYSWPEQIKSMQKLENYKNVRSIFPGHGRIYHLNEKETFPQLIQEVCAWMKSID